MASEAANNPASAVDYQAAAESALAVQLGPLQETASLDGPTQNNPKPEAIVDVENLFPDLCPAGSEDAAGGQGEC